MKKELEELKAVNEKLRLQNSKLIDLVTEMSLEIKRTKEETNEKKGTETSC